MYSQMIEISENEVRSFNFYNNANIREDRYTDLYDDMYTDTTDFIEAWVNHGLEFDLMLQLNGGRFMTFIL